MKTKVLRFALLAVILTFVLSALPIQAQGPDLSELGSVTVNYSDGSRVMCATGVLDNGWSGGMWIPAPGSPSPSVWASCNVPYTLTNVTSVTFATRSNPDVVVEIECEEGFIPENPELFCRVANPS